MDRLEQARNISSNPQSERTAITLHLLPHFDRRYLPVEATAKKTWWQDNDRTKDHAHHCQPLGMANSLGFYILSPATFTVEWDGCLDSDTIIVIEEHCSHCLIDPLSAYGSFTIQLGFVPTTKAPGDFIFIKGVPNERALPYSCMEALIEAWWSKAAFGLVFLMNQPGKFRVGIGEPIAQMFVYRGDAGLADLNVTDEVPSEYWCWREKRQRADYVKDLDYLFGRHPDGSEESTHYRLWRHAKNVR